MSSEFIPTYLYIKQHRITKKLYFGKTIKNPENYLGSGIHWKNHIKKHGNLVDTIWYCLYIDKDTIIEAATSFSKLWNIVGSDNWLNLIVEDGIGNGIPVGTKFTEEHKKKISESNKGQIPWSKGKKLPKSFGNKISKTKLSRKKKYSDLEKKNISSGTKLAMNDEQIKQKCSAPHIKNWTIINPEGNQLKISNLSEFCRINNLNKRSMLNVAQDKQNNHRGWKCFYDNIKSQK